MYVHGYISWVPSCEGTLCVCVCRMCGWIPPHAAAGMAALLQKRIFKFSYNRKPSDQIISQQVNFLWEGDRLGADVFFNTWIKIDDNV